MNNTSDKKLGLENAAPWPVIECLISSHWPDNMRLTDILITKKPPFDGVVCCAFQVDLGCMGPKQAFVTQFRTFSEYENRFRSSMMNRGINKKVDYSLAAKILQESIVYSEQLGFSPPQMIINTLKALGSLKCAKECDEEIPLGGDNGKPLYVAGMDDDSDQIIKILEERCGKGNFHYIASNSPFLSDFFN